MTPQLKDRAESTLQRASNWLERTEAIRPDGSVVAWLAPEDPAREFISAEITGYAVSHLCLAGDLPRAWQGAQWLISEAQDQEGAFRCRWYKDAPDSCFSADGPLRWIFDAAVILKALVDVYGRTARPALRSPIQRAVDFLLRIRDQRGLFPACWNASLRQPEHDASRWSAQSSSFHAKVDLAIVAASLALDMPCWRADVPDRVETYLREYQQPSGRFLSYPAASGTHAHPHLYSCESLWALGSLLDQPAWIRAARSGVAWIAGVSADGRPPRTCFNGDRNYNGRCDVAAQYLRSLVLFGLPEARDLACDRLCDYAGPDGAMLFGRNADGSLNRHPDTWGTIAAAQALRWYLGRETPRPLQLI